MRQCRFDISVFSIPIPKWSYLKFDVIYIKVNLNFHHKISSGSETLLLISEETYFDSLLIQIV